VSILQLLLQAFLPIGVQFLEAEIKKLTPAQATAVGQTLSQAHSQAQAVVAAHASGK